MKTEPERFSYGIGASAVVAISIGLAAIVYGLGLLSVDLYVLPAWILAPLGIYTTIYSISAGRESTYYLVWGIVMVFVAFLSAFYNVAYVTPVMGLLIIVLAVIGLVAYMRGKK